jgi:hypothetical protein
MLKIITPAEGEINSSSTLYIPDRNSSKTRRWLENLAISHTSGRGFKKDGYDKYGMTLQDRVEEMLEMDIGRFPMDMFWFILDSNNQVAGIVGYLDNGPHRAWGTASSTKDIDGTPYLEFGLESDFGQDFYLFVQERLDEYNRKLVTGCSPVFNPYDPNYALFWRLMDGAGIRVANPPQ